MAGVARDQGWYRSLLDSTSDAIIVLDSNGEIQYVNRAIERMLGYEPDEMVGRSGFEFVHEDDTEAVAEQFLDFTVGDGPEHPTITFRIRDADGEWRYVESTGRTRFQGGEADTFVVSLREVTDRRRREQELARYETIIETAPLGLFVLDETGAITWTNEEFAELHAIPQSELVGTPFRELIERGFYDESVEEKYVEHVGTLLSDDGSDSASYTATVDLPEAGTRTYDVRVTLLPLEDGEFQGTVIAYRDVTKRREYEAELERQNERLDRFASTVSHDLRNPLSVAKGRVDLARETDDLEHLEHVEKAHERMESLIGRLLSLARHDETGEMQSVPLAGVARKAWEAVDADDATLETAAAERIVVADPTRLRQVFENLFRNAVEHGRTDGEPLVVTVGTLEDDDGFFVADDGRGIPPEDRDRVFEYGYSTAEEGTGFGLDIVESVVEAHGWTVSLSDPDEGTRFEIVTDDD